MGERFAIIGESLFSLALAADLIRGGADARLVLAEAGAPDASGARRTVKLKGAAEAEVELGPTAREWSSVSEADLIIMNATAESCEGLLAKLLPHLHKGQSLVVFPSGFLVFIIKRLLERHGLSGITVCELVSSPVVCDAESRDVIRIHKYKNELKLSASPAGELPRMLATLNRYLRILVPAADSLETSLENINAILHPLPILLNLAELERKGERFRHFMDGVSPVVSALLERMDSERLAIGRAFSLKLSPTLEHLKSFYGSNDCGTLYDYIRSPECPYAAVSGFGLKSRYIMQDIPCLLVPASRLARVAGVRCPLTDACIELGSAAAGVDFGKTGSNLARLGLEGKGIEEILRLAAG